MKLAQEHDLTCPILLRTAPGDARVFDGLGTPAAYLIDEEGRVAEPLAVGAHHVPGLARKAVTAAAKTKLPGERPLSESRIERDGLKAGTPAPVFHLPDVDGRTVSLETYRGRRVFLVFSDPHCGPCDQLLPRLARLHREHHKNNLAVLLVGRGDVDENRRKAKIHSLQFPVVVQHKWEVSKQFGIFGTPVAFLLDERGVVARDVAKGADEILALVSSELNEEARDG